MERKIKHGSTSKITAFKDIETAEYTDQSIIEKLVVTKSGRKYHITEDGSQLMSR